MNIVIPYRIEANNGLELKFALRSIEAYLTGYDEIYIIGSDYPNWLQNVRRIDVHEESRKTSANIVKKILGSFNHAGSAVLQWQDDIYLQKPLDVSDIKYWYNGTLEDAVKRSHGHYKELVISTAMKIGEEFKYYDTHTPIIYEEIRFNYVSNYWLKKDYLLKTMYCQSLNPDGEELQDCKIGQPMTKAEVLQKIDGKLFWSTGPQGMSDEVIEILNEIYPNKSKYEA